MMATSDAMVCHMVYFTLKERTDGAVKRQLDACRKYLTGHDGTVFFAIGTRTPDLTREVNDKEFDVGLHVVFRDRAAHDAYQKHARHLQFIEENKAHWARVRVFDADVA
jgi:hypothetical protein